jgi:hypothetical protein
MGALALLRWMLKALNLAMLFLGVGLLTYSGVMWEQLGDAAAAGGGGSAPPDAPPPPSAPAGGDAAHGVPWCERRAERCCRVR